jgi:uncharacterized membrane protein SpoIIM required for sporulation
MQSDQFYQSRQSDWQSLTNLLDRAQGGVTRLSADDIQQMGRLYRAATSDLAIAQRDFPSQRVTLYLNQLVARAHAVLYRGEPLAWRRLVRFVTGGFARAYRETFPYTLAAMALFILPALIAGLSTALQPASAQWMLPPDFQRLTDMIEEGELWTNIDVEERPYASAFIMRNNIQVAFLAFGGGMLAGLLTVWVMIFNGLILGGITGLTIHYGIGFELWTFVIGHGVIELSVIMMAGGSGLMLGWAILHPGLLRRRDALALAARRALKLVIGCVPLLVLAGTIEGFLSPAENVPWQMKWSIGIGSGLALYAYLLFAGRNTPARD